MNFLTTQLYFCYTDVRNFHMVLFLGEICKTAPKLHYDLKYNRTKCKLFEIVKKTLIIISLSLERRKSLKSHTYVYEILQELSNFQYCCCFLSSKLSLHVLVIEILHILSFTCIELYDTDVKIIFFYFNSSFFAFCFLWGYDYHKQILELYSKFRFRIEITKI